MPRRAAHWAVILGVPLLSGCTVLGGMIGARMDAAEFRTSTVPLSQAGGIEPGTTVFVTRAGRETLRGSFRGVADRSLGIESEGTPLDIPLDSVDDLAEVREPHQHRDRGLAIGAAVDLAIIGGGGWLLYERQQRSIHTAY